MLHIPGGNLAPWSHGLWMALGRAYVNKEHALNARSNYSSKLANPARVAKAPIGATELQRVGFLSRVIAWGINTVFELPPGWDVALLESNGRGWEVFQSEIDTSDKEMVLCLAGQTVTTDGGAGFANSDIHKSIRADLIKATADSLAYTINTQGLPQWVVAHWGVDAIETRAQVEWDVEPAKDRLAEANSLIAVANAIGLLRTNLQPYGRDVDVVSMATRFGVPIAGDGNGDGVPDELQAQPEAQREAA
jgi:phage gp29-like protein